MPLLKGAENTKNVGLSEGNCFKILHKMQMANIFQQVQKQKTKE